jgi:hypothetical protein
LTELTGLTLSGLGHRCRRESDRFFRGEGSDPSFCLELFRLALVERNEDAWELVFETYRPLVLSWVRKHPAFPNCGEEDQYFVNRAFERMWTNLPAERYDRTARLPALLDYLKLCVHSAIIDHTRRQGPISVSEEVLTVTGDPHPGPEANVEDRIAGRELWEMIKKKANDEMELCFLFAYFTLDLKPRQIAAEYPQFFAGIQDVYRTRERIFDRLRRDPDLEAFQADY